MKTKKQFLWMVLAILVCGFTAVTLASCGSDDDDSGSGSSSAAMLSTPLTLEAIGDGKIIFKNPCSKLVYYRVNGGEKNIIEGSSSKTSSRMEIDVKAGDKVEFYCDGFSCAELKNRLQGSRSRIFEYYCGCYIYGNIMSLIRSDNFENASDVNLGSYAFWGLFNNCYILNHPTKKLILPATRLSTGCYMCMFENCGLTEAPELPATTLATLCYSGMFKGCGNLTKAPELPATTLAIGCYGEDIQTLGSSGMFQGCTKLTKAPALPATTLADLCYRCMFYGCTGLTEAPELPATTLAKSCYSSMFYGCTGLTEAPELPATTLADYCYSGMFAGCENLSSVTCLATDISATDFTSSWLSGVASTGTFTKAKGVDWPRNKSGIPEGWTVVEK